MSSFPNSLRTLRVLLPSEKIPRAPNRFDRKVDPTVTLAVSVHRVDPTTGALGPDLIAEPGADLGGCEGWRTKVYASGPVRRRGATFLPTLANANLSIEGSHLDLFRAECARLLVDATDLSAELGVDPDSLAHRLRNFVHACDLARTVEGVVLIE
jgi:hypothetical protein